MIATGCLLSQVIFELHAGSRESHLGVTELQYLTQTLLALSIAADQTEALESEQAAPTTAQAEVQAALEDAPPLDRALSPSRATSAPARSSSSSDSESLGLGHASVMSAARASTSGSVPVRADFPIRGLFSQSHRTHASLAFRSP